MRSITCTVLIALALLLAHVQEGRADDSVLVYRAGDVTVMRLADKQGGVPPQVFAGADKALLEKELHGQICPAMFLTFLVKTPEDMVLVDSGNGEERQGRTHALLRQLGVPAEAVTKILLTHMHGDHVLGLFSGKQAAFPSAEIYVEASEFRFWTDRKNMSRAPSGMGANFDNAERLAQIYKGRIRLFTAGDKLFPWLASVALPGHTEGHTGFLVERAGRRLLLAGDFLHCLAVQAAHPEVAVIWDSDQELAKRTRLQTLRQAAGDGTVVLGDHFANPGAVRFTERGAGFAYEFVQPDAR